MRKFVLTILEIAFITVIVGIPSYIIMTSYLKVTL